MSFAPANADSKVSVENDSGEIEILEEKLVGDEYVVKVAGRKPGVAVLKMDFGDHEASRVLYVHKGMIITEDSYFGRATGSEVVPIAISIASAYILYLLVREYRAAKRENFYRYRNITYLSIIIFLSFFLVANFVSIFNYQGLLESTEKIVHTIVAFSTLLFPFALVAFVFITICSVILIKKEGWSVRNLFALMLSISMCVLTLLPGLAYRILAKSQIASIYDLNSAGPYIYNFLATLVYLTVIYLECILVSTIAVAVVAAKRKIEMDKDYMIILGCKVLDDGSLTPILQRRVDRALDFRNAQLEATGKDLIFIPSGGKGDDEKISEAEAMEKYLLEHGIKKKQILIENRSKNTDENIKFSNRLVGDKKAKVGFATTNYHVFRAGLLATKQGLKLEGIGAQTKTYFWTNALIREFIGTLYAERKNHMLFFSLIVLAVATMIGLTHLG